MNVLKLLSWNVNGIRAVQKKGFWDWFENEKADIVCLQETKARPEQLDEKSLHPLKYHSVWSSAEKAGYSGVAVYFKKEPLDVIEGLGKKEFDLEGRVIQLVYKDFVLINAYFPNSQREHTRLPYKLKFCDLILKRSQKWIKEGKNVILCGDYNIAHTELDLKNPKTNQSNAGFLPEERDWMTKFLKAGFKDIFRRYWPEPDHYTWWSYRPGVRDRNIGWRLDYHCINSEFEDRIKASEHQPHVRGSDHCPVLLKLKK